MVTPTATQLEAIQRVAGRPEGEAILEYLKACMDDIQGRLIYEEDAQRVRAFQGESRVLNALLKVWKP
jgi:hypothetical protein